MLNLLIINVNSAPILARFWDAANTSAAPSAVPFEAALALVPRTRLRALVAAPGGLALARAVTAAHPLLGVLGALWRTQVAQIHK